MPSQELSPDLSASRSLIEALMAHVIQEAGFCYWNIHQDGFDALREPLGHLHLFPITLGDLTVKIHECEDDPSDFKWMSYSFRGLTVNTCLDSKRMFYHSNLSIPMSRYSITDWFESLIEHLNDVRMSDFIRDHPLKTKQPSCA